MRHLLKESVMYFLDKAGVLFNFYKGEKIQVEGMY